MQKDEEKKKVEGKPSEEKQTADMKGTELKLEDVIPEEFNGGCKLAPSL